MNESTFSDALGEALDTALSADERVVVVGGSKWQARDPLADVLRRRHGNQRIIATPSGNDGILGMAFGMAVAGLRPVADIGFNGSSSQSYGQIVDHVSKIRYRSDRRFSAPMVIRIRQGSKTGDGSHHAEFESALAHVPGLKVVVPSNPRAAHGLMLTAIGDPDPVVFLEQTRPDGLMDDEFPNVSPRVEIGAVRQEQEGKIVTLFSWGAMMTETRQAATRLGEKGVSVELIDIQTLLPLDRDGIAASVNKTGRAVVIQEGPIDVGFSSDIAASIQERCLYSLFAPVQRVTIWGTDFLESAEAAHRPSVDRIVAAALRTLG